jgi:hypothetical protein
VLDTSATCHMTFQRDFFEDFNDKSSNKPLRFGTIGLKLPGLPDFLLHNVLYLLELRRNLLPLCTSDSNVALSIFSEAKLK